MASWSASGGTNLGGYSPRTRLAILPVGIDDDGYQDPRRSGTTRCAPGSNHAISSGRSDWEVLVAIYLFETDDSNARDNTYSWIARTWVWVSKSLKDGMPRDSRAPPSTMAANCWWTSEVA
jgi:hypothetical protein